jgi:hypothetical protein
LSFYNIDQIQQLFNIMLLGVWTLYDIVLICVGSYK